MAKTTGERKLDRKLVGIYDKYGLDMFLDVCSEMLIIKDSNNGDKKKRVNGEVCEVVLRVLTEHYLHEHGLPGYVFHSMVLKNKSDPKSDFRTELDYTLLTPFFCATCECKSFAGQVVVKGECTLDRGDIQADVARQSKVHQNALIPYLKDYVKPGLGIPTPPLELFCFVYNNGTVKDGRTSTAQWKLPVLRAHNLNAYLDGLFRRYKREVYDVEKAAKKFQAMANSRVLHIQHANYLGY